jgi:K+-sensing histidine kinase KdpD
MASRAPVTPTIDSGLSTGAVEVLLAEPDEAESAAAPDRCPHVLVCIGGQAIDRELIRQGRVLADLMHGRLTVLYPFRLGVEERDRTELARDRVYAREAGAQLVELPAYSSVDGIVEFASARDVTHLVLSDRTSATWYGARPDSMPERLVERLGPVDLYLLTEPRDRRGAVGP